MGTFVRVGATVGEEAAITSEVGAGVVGAGRCVGGELTDCFGPSTSPDGGAGEVVK